MIANSRSPSRRVLIVDDEPAARVLTARALARVGLKCEVAADGTEALAKLQSEHFDVIVTDIRMPNGNGHALAVELLGRPERPMIVVLTGVLEPRIARDLILRGVDELCFKPVDYFAFAAKVAALVERRTAHPTTTTSKHLPNASLNTEANASVTDATAPPEPIPTPVFPESAPPVRNAMNEVAAQPQVNQGPDDSVVGPSEDVQDNLPARPACEPCSAANVSVRPVAAILLRNAARARELADGLTREQVDALAVASSEELYGLLNSQRVDLVIIEHELGGFLNGLEILERLYKDLLRPDTILLADSGWSLQERAAELGIEKRLESNADVRQIIGAANAVLACRSATKPFIPQRARQLVEQYEHIPPLPQLLIKLLSYMDLEAQDVPLKQLADDISVDPKATASLLSLTNSSSTGLRQRITRVFDAVNLLGSRRTIALVVASATMTSQTELLKEWSEPLRNWYRQRSVLIASAAATFARRLENVSPDTAFVLGLLQDLGILVLGSCFTGRYVESTLRRAREIGQLQLQVVEQEDYKLTHPEVSAALLQKWGLPQSLIGLVLNHHKPDRETERSRVDQSFLRVMQIGEALADLHDLAHPVRRQALNRLLAEYTESRAELCRDCLAEAVAQTMEACRLFSLPLPNETTMRRLVERLERVREAATEAEALSLPASPTV